MSAKLRGAGEAIVFLSAYAPMAESKDKDKDKDKCYDEFAAAASENEKGSFLYIGGDFNARLCKRQSHETGNIGEYIITRK